MPSLVDDSPPSSPNSQGSTSGSVGTEDLLSECGSHSGSWPEVGSGKGARGVKVESEEKFDSSCDAGFSVRQRSAWKSRIFFVLSLVHALGPFWLLGHLWSTIKPPLHRLGSIEDYAPKVHMEETSNYEPSFNLVYSTDDSLSKVAMPLSRGHLLVTIKTPEEQQWARIAIASPCEIDEIHLKLRAAKRCGTQHCGPANMVTTVNAISNLYKCSHYMRKAEELRWVSIVVERTRGNGFRIRQSGIYRGIETLEPLDPQEAGGFDWRWQK